MPDNHVYRIIQVAGSSENSIEDAIQNAVRRASRTLRQVGWFEVLETRGHVEDGKVVIVELYSDDKGNYFKPAKLEVHRGDLIRFTLKSGVHNVHFLPDSNPGAQGLPPASEFLQIPEQTWDYVVGLAPGHYYFQCDPHALLGMVGRLEVEDEK